jgi:hypothetical protein
VFTLDGQAYESVDLVPEPGVRDLIRAAVAAWEGQTRAEG